MKFLEIFLFEVSYRVKRPETYAFFLVTILIGFVSVDFIFEGGLGAVKMNSPYAVALSMSLSQIILMLISSMIMGLAVLRDHQYVMESLMFVTSITKRVAGLFIYNLCMAVYRSGGANYGFLKYHLLCKRDA